MVYSNSPKDTVLQLSVGESNNSQKKITNLKRIIIRRFKGLWYLSIQKKIIYFLIIMICYWFLYPTNYNRDNRVIQHQAVANENLKLDYDDSLKFKKVYTKISRKPVRDFKQSRLRH